MNGGFVVETKLFFLSNAIKFTVIDITNVISSPSRIDSMRMHCLCLTRCELCFGQCVFCFESLVSGHTIIVIYVAMTECTLDVHFLVYKPNAWLV